MLTGILAVISACIGIPIFSNGVSQIIGQAHNIGTYLTVILGIFLILISIFIKLIKKLFIYPLFKLLWGAISFALVLSVISSAFLFIYGKADTTTYKENYLVVLGCGINGTEPTETLLRRLDKAIEYANKNTECTIIVTGGMGVGEDITEAQAMYNYLTEKGILPERILQETRATSTFENFSFSNEITGNDLQNKSAVFITNDFHVYRANSLAKLLGFSMNHLSASTPAPSIIPSYLRENLALVKMLLFNE